jgi:hypothetical protein
LWHESRRKGSSLPQYCAKQVFDWVPWQSRHCIVCLVDRLKSNENQNHPSCQSAWLPCHSRLLVLRNS